MDVSEVGKISVMFSQIVNSLPHHQAHTTTELAPPGSKGALKSVFYDFDTDEGRIFFNVEFEPRVGWNLMGFLVWNFRCKLLNMCKQLTVMEF